MEDLFQGIDAWVIGHPGLTNVILFLIAMGESTAVIGVVVPGVVSLIGTGALVATGVIGRAR